MKYEKFCIELNNNIDAHKMHLNLKEIYQFILSSPEYSRRFVLADSGFTISEENWDFVENAYPDLEKWRQKYHLEKHILFLSTPTDAPHSHLRTWPSSLCFPIIGANPDTWTYWVEPAEPFTRLNSQFRHEVQRPKEQADETRYTDLAQLPKWGESDSTSYPYGLYTGAYRVLKKHCIQHHPVIFDGNQWHYVISELKDFDRHSRRCVNWAAELHWDEFADLFFENSN